jgi:hypothetical protein
MQQVGNITKNSETSKIMVKQQTARQQLTANQIAATKPVKIGSSFVLDFSDRPKRKFIK